MTNAIHSFFGVFAATVTDDREAYQPNVIRKMNTNNTKYSSSPIRVIIVHAYFTYRYQYTMQMQHNMTNYTEFIQWLR